MAQPLRIGEFLDFSPIKPEDTTTLFCDKENTGSLELPVLSLVQFSRAPFVTFGSVKIGSSKSVVLRVENPDSDNGATEVTVNKIASAKGFSVDKTIFNIQPGDVFDLTITWTPGEEGGVRELIIFVANGVVKHQAVLLGRANAPKKKKKSLWDSIKNKKASGLPAPSRGKRTPEASLKRKAANKTFHVPQTPQYRQGRVRSPLSPLNDVVPVRARALSGFGPSHMERLELQGICTLVSKVTSQPLDEVNRDGDLTSSPGVPPVPRIRISDPAKTAAVLSCPVFPSEHRDVARVLNKTLSPVGTPDRLKNLMPHIESMQVPVSVALPEASIRAPTVMDALAMIDSDLTAAIEGSPPDACSSFDFSDSLESVNGIAGCGSDGLPDSPSESDAAQPRLTFFIKPKSAVGQADDLVAPRIEAGCNVFQAKKVFFTSATVVKSRAAPALVERPQGERKIKTSRRRLLEKTLEITDAGSCSNSSPGTVGLPVIDSNSSSDGQHNVSITSSSLEAMDPVAVSLSPLNDPAPVSFSLSPPLLRVPVTPQHHKNNQLAHGAPLSGFASAQLPVHQDLFPVCCQSRFDVVTRGKKRKSDEFLKDVEKVEDTEKIALEKRSRKSTAVKSQDVRKTAAQKQPRTAASLRSGFSSSLERARSVTPAPIRRPSSKATFQSTSLKSFGASSVRKAKVVAVAQSTLTFIKPAQTAIPRHPMPFAAKNMFYDERWIEKQERGFTWWMNYVLTPDDFKVNTEVTKVNALSLAMGSDERFSVPKAPTKEEMSFSTYTARRRLNRLRRSACQLFTSEVMIKAIQRLELEVEAKRLLVRTDRHLWKDIGERQKVLNWLLSYNPLWLRIGLETIYGEMIPLESNSDVMGLAMFILRRLLWNPDIAAQFRHAKVPNLYKDGHEEALSRFTLKKLLLLVCFLDKAKESRMIEHDPCLFCMDAEFKTSKDLLLAFSRDFLSGEGILPRHMGYLGFPVSHTQTPLDEFNFAVKNLATDLKCGIRLVRVMELFTQDWSLSQKLRMPAISRLQKVHNVDIALQVLKAKGVDLKDNDVVISSRDVVDGHREKTLSLLWKIIFAFQVEVLLDEEKLTEEIGFLKRAWSVKQKLASLKADKVVEQTVSKAGSPFKHSSLKITLLMDWVNAVCDFYNLKVENFSVSFSDGRALCYLIHHYHPSQLPLERVSQSTTQTVECSSQGRLELNCSSSDSDNSFDTWPTTQNVPQSPMLEFKELLDNEKSNFRLVNTAVSFLGGVPAMINSADMSNTIPNEKVVMSYLSFLCTRLLDLRNETRAARIIQGAWRKHKLRKDLETYQERNVAAARIQAHVRNFLKRRRARKQTCAAVRLQAAWRGYAARNTATLMRKANLWALLNASATSIQAEWRRYITRKNYQSLRSQVIVLQACWRMKRAVSDYRTMRWAATVIQKHTRARITGRKERENYLALRSAAIKIQRSYRNWTSRKFQIKNHAASVIQAAFRKWRSAKTARRNAAALKIQSWFRMHTCHHRYVSVRLSAVLIQTWYRGQQQRRRLQVLKQKHHAATIIQSAFKASVVRRRLERMRRAAVVIQRRFRASLLRDAEKRTFLAIKCATVTIQAMYRGNVARRMMKEKNRAATLIQANFRKLIAHRRFAVLKRSVVAIQQKYRAKLLGTKSRKSYEELRCSVLKIQAVWRGRTDRKRIEQLHKCATVLQANYRRHAVQSRFRARKEAALLIQRQFRALKAAREGRAEYLQVKKAVISLQAGLRGMKVRTELKKKHQAATLIQSSVRAFICKRRYLLLESAAIILQSRYRAHLACRLQHQQYSRLKRATLKLQAAYRGSRVRRDLSTRRRAATVLQAHFRMYKVRVSYLATKCAAIIIQERYRANMLRDHHVWLYGRMRSATVKIQSAYRGHRVRTAVAEMHTKAVVIQRWFLARMERKRFLAVRAAAVLCQQRYRAVAIGQKERKNYLLKQRAAITLQAAYRGRRDRQRLQTECIAAITIQSHVRMHLIRTQYKRMLWAVGTVQVRYRANKLVEREMLSLNAKKKAIIVLQSAFRGIITRRAVKWLHESARVIQSCYRAHVERKRYLALRSSALVIQRQYRATLAAKLQRQHYLNMLRAAVLLQATYRGQLARREIGFQHQAATTIQAAFRRHRAHVKFQAMRLSAVILQRHFRLCVQGRLDRDRFLELRGSAVVIQAVFRGLCVRSQVAKMHRAATVIQANYRMKKQQDAFRRQRWAVGILQQRFRAQRLRHVQVEKYLQIRSAVTCIQASFRGMQARRLATRAKAARKIQAFLQMSVRRRRFLKERTATVVIQSAFRRHRARARYIAMQASIVTVQRWYRSCRLGRKVRLDYMTVRGAAVTLQSAVRGTLARRLANRERAAVKVQSVLRMAAQRSRYLKMWSSTVTLQSHCRRWAARRRFQRCRLAALTLQRSYRGLRAQREQRSVYLKTLRDVQKLQARVRGHIAFRRYQRIKKSTVTIQAFYRGMVDRQRLRQQRTSVALIQEHYRAHLLRQRERAKYLAVKRSAVLIQSWFRGKQARSKLVEKRAAVATVHRCIQTNLLRKRFLTVRHSALVLQRRWRETVKAQEDRQNFLRKKASAVTIQAAWRGHRERQSLLVVQKAALCIQSVYRGWIQRRAYQRQRGAAVVLQTRFRAAQLARREREDFSRVRQSTVTLQRYWRSCMGNRRVLAAAAAGRRLRFSAAVFHHLCAVRIQKALRAHWALQSARRQIHSVVRIQRWVRARQQRRRFLDERRKVVTAQRAARRWLARRHRAARVLQQHARKFLLLRRQQRVEQGIIKAQALWRGHASRKLHDHHRVVAVRHRLRMVSDGAQEEDRLCHKTSMAIDHLLQYKHFSYILSALKNLELATRLSPECCEMLVESGATLVIFTLIRSCNRSVPCMEVISYAIQVLLNLSKYHKTVEAVYMVENSVNTLLDLLQIYREKAGDKVAEKGGSIFTKACFLLALLLQDPRRALEVRKLPKALERIQSIYSLTARKHKMDARRERQKTNASRNCSLLNSTTTTTQKHKPVAKFAPDWVLRKDKLKDVVDPLRAIQMVADAFVTVA
ncbi:abnormal spindle-like microcephaly-associated protein [Osmerus mordax]|uniref:abnormal spindle-like microcephaly-associated protein n=1 Tax=Osmerus mordax TaxID=8014 RepID=UPI00350FF788